MNSPQRFEEEFLSCGICYDIFKEPKVLPCLHTFCLTCLTSYISTTRILDNKTGFLCPTCRELIHPPRPSHTHWAKQFRDNFYVKNLIDANSNQEIPEAVSNQNLCESHKFPLHLCCVDCDKIVCVQCSVVSHRTCRKIIPVEQLATEKRSHLKAYQSSIQDQISKIAASLTEVEREKQNLEFQKNSLGVLIKKKGEEMSKLVALETAATLSRLDGAISASQVELKTDGDHKRMLMSKLSAVSNSIDKLIKTPDSYVFDNFAAILKDGETVSKELPTTIEIPAFQTEFKESICPSSFIGDIVKTSNMRTLSKLSEFVQEPSVAQNKIQSEDSPFIKKYKSLKLISEINTKTKSDHSKVNLKDICAVSGNIIVVTDQANKKIKSFYKHGTSFKEHESVVPAAPHGIAKIGSNGIQIAVTLPAAKQIAIVTISPAIIIDKIIKTTKKFWGITSIGATSFAVSTCSGSEPGLIVIMDTDGNELKTLSKSRRHTSNPLYLTTLSSGNLVVSDCTIGRIIKLQPDGEVLSIKDRFNNILISPMGICTDRYDCLIVADNRHLTILNEIGQVKKQIDLNLPKGQRSRSVYVSDEDEVYVITENNQIFLYVPY